MVSLVHVTVKCYGTDIVQIAVETQRESLLILPGSIRMGFTKKTLSDL